MRRDRPQADREPSRRDLTRAAAELIVKTAADALAEKLGSDPGRARDLLVDCVRRLEDES